MAASAPFVSRSFDRGHALVEVLIASILLAIAAGYIASGMLNTKRIFRTSTYQYVAVNLAREVLEFGVSTNYYHDNARHYAYTGSGYSSGGWDSYMQLGDIKARGLVPKLSPNSVDIEWSVVRDPNFYNYFRHQVSITWEEDGTRHRRDISTIPITTTNDQLHLALSEFTWKSK